MRDLPTILDDIKQYLVSHGLTEDLKDLEEEIRVGALKGKLWSYVGTWFATFQIVSEYDVVLADLLEEYFVCCHSQGIYPV